MNMQNNEQQKKKKKEGPSVVVEDNETGNKHREHFWRKPENYAHFEPRFLWENANDYDVLQGMDGEKAAMFKKEIDARNERRDQVFGDHLQRYIRRRFPSETMADQRKKMNASKGFEKRLRNVGVNGMNGYNETLLNEVFGKYNSAELRSQQHRIMKVEAGMMELNDSDRIFSAVRRVKQRRKRE